MDRLFQFFRGKKIFITGHTGFKGTWLCIWLRMMGARICGFSLAPPTPLNFYTLSGIANDISSIEADIRDFEALHKAITKFQPDIVIHLAAQALVRRSYADPVETYSTNIMGTVNLLESIRRIKNIKAVINVTSDKCYEDKKLSRGYKETDQMGGFDPYSSSKGCSELITSAYSRSFFSAKSSNLDIGTYIASARAGNVIGGGDFAQDRLIPDMVKAFLNKKTVNIRHPEAIRPWQHVIEPLFGYLLLSWKLYEHGAEFSGPWNFGPDNAGLKNVGYLADKFAALWKDGAGWVQEDPACHPHESHVLELDPSKARALLAWQTRWDIDQILIHTAEWYKCYRDTPQKLMDLSELQIRTYERLINEVF